MKRTFLAIISAAAAIALASCSGSEDSPVSSAETAVPAPIEHPVVLFNASITDMVSMEGFSPPNPNGAWSVGDESRISMSLPDGTEGLLFRMTPYFPPAAFTEGSEESELVRNVVFTINGETVLEETWTPSALPSPASSIDRRFVLPSDVDGEVTFGIEITPAGSPADWGTNEDTRVLGVFVRQIETFASE